jgi:hypothetical protein
MFWYGKRMNTMSKRNNLFVGIGVGLLIAAFVIKLFDLSWLVVSTGVLLLIVGGIGFYSKNDQV